MPIKYTYIQKLELKKLINKKKGFTFNLSANFIFFIVN